MYVRVYLSARKKLIVNEFEFFFYQQRQCVLINVRKPGVPDSMEQKRLVHYILCSTGVLQLLNIFYSSGLDSISRIVLRVFDERECVQRDY